MGKVILKFVWECRDTRTVSALENQREAGKSALPEMNTAVRLQQRGQCCPAVTDNPSPTPKSVQGQTHVRQFLSEEGAEASQREDEVPNEWVWGHWTLCAQMHLPSYPTCASTQLRVEHRPEGKSYSNRPLEENTREKSYWPWIFQHFSSRIQMHKPSREKI